MIADDRGGALAVPLPDLITPAVEMMREHHQRALQADANAVQRAGAYLDMAQPGIGALGQTAQQLHGAAATFDPSAPDSEARAAEILARTYQYLYVNNITFELDGSIGGLEGVRDNLASGGSRLKLPRTKRRREDAVAELSDTISSVISLLNRIAGQTRHLAGGTGLGAETLARIYAILDDLSWRQRPAETRTQLKNMASLFQASQDNVEWQAFSGEISALKEKLLATFPPP